MLPGGAGRTCVEGTIPLDSIWVGFGHHEALRVRRGDPLPLDAASDGPTRSIAVPSLISDAVDAYVVRRLKLPADERQRPRRAFIASRA